MEEEEHCCQVSPRFLSQFEKKILQNTEEVLHSHISIFKWFGKEIFFNQTKFKTPKIDLLTKLPLKKLKIVRQDFQVPFGQNWGLYGHQFFLAKRYFYQPLLSYLAEFSATWRTVRRRRGEVAWRVPPCSPSALLQIMPISLPFILFSILSYLILWGYCNISDYFFKQLNGQFRVF